VYARGTTLRASREDVEEAIVHYQDGIPSFSEIVGNRGAFLLVDRSAGKAISVTLWESDEAMRHADELRQRPAQESSGESVDEYEVAVWAVS
jgi:heme-degrading monooxygenase HmoA